MVSKFISRPERGFEYGANTANPRGSNNVFIAPKGGRVYVKFVDTTPSVCVKASFGNPKVQYRHGVEAQPATFFNRTSRPCNCAHRTPEDCTRKPEDCTRPSVAVVGGRTLYQCHPAGNSCSQLIPTYPIPGSFSWTRHVYELKEVENGRGSVVSGISKLCVQ